MTTMQGKQERSYQAPFSLWLGVVWESSVPFAFSECWPFPVSSSHAIPPSLWQVEEEAHQPPLDDLPAFLRKEAIMEAYPWGTKCLFPLQFHDAFLCSVFSTAWPDLWFFFAIWFISLVVLYCFKSARGHLWRSLFFFFSFFNTNYKSKSWECHLKVRDEREV